MTNKLFEFNFQPNENRIELVMECCKCHSFENLDLGIVVVNDMHHLAALGQPFMAQFIELHKGCRKPN